MVEHIRSIHLQVCNNHEYATNVLGHESKQHKSDQDSHITTTVDIRDSLTTANKGPWDTVYVSHRHATIKKCLEQVHKFFDPHSKQSCITIPLI